MATGDLETAAAAGAEQLESSESEGRSAELEVFIPLRRLVNGEKGFESRR